MGGTKRSALSDSIPDTYDSVFGNKRILAGSSFDIQRAEPSQQQKTKTPTLDVRRAESSRQHVRALNTQFASWVQSQLANHPDELWEGGVRDYLTHASSIMEKFSDIVEWLKANAVKGESSPSTGSPTTEKKTEIEHQNTDLKPFQGQTGFPPTSATTNSATSWTSGAFFNHQAPSIFGLQNSVPANGVSVGQTAVPTSESADDENDLEQPSSPSVKKSEEKGVVVVHEVKCKLYVKSTDPADKDAWKDKGTGQLSIKCKEGISKGSKESKPTIVIRNDVGRLLLNALIYPGIKTNTQKNSIVAIFHTSSEGDTNDNSDKDKVVARTYLIRLKTEDDRNKLATAIQECAPAP
ncbi:hypothetical protein IC582_022318 [Cucumis melo]|uniref:RanBD1 domain-containing protein n=2 Tax=Cucumis melo TaxID=3656 RepID=A0A5A7TMK5_CUCMM|nr:uncharacterized protein LOC103482703 isoform X1 [Cucumis melo]KAA0042801.1 uncharacterized protein E6C27_scaffold44G003040 [Cucumis melo var. makuwa]